MPIKWCLRGVVALAIFGLLACPESKGPPRLPKRTSPVPEKSQSRDLVELTQEGAPTETVLLEKALSIPVVTRFSTPGYVRWREGLNAPVTFIRWSPLTGLIVTAGRDVHNITSRGENRWRYVAGESSQIFAMDDLEVVWSPAFHRLSGLKKGGQQAWVREWRGQLSDDGKGGVYLFDASTASALGKDGSDRWRVALEGVRKIDGPFLCEDGMLFQGSSGLQRVVIRVSQMGRVISTKPLGRGALLLGAGPACEPLIFVNGNLAMMGERGKSRWQMSASETPFIQRLIGGFGIISSHKTQSQFTLFRDDGSSRFRVSLPVSGRVTTARILPGNMGQIAAIGMCLDVTSPCAQPLGTRGPHNVLLTGGRDKSFRVLIRHIQGHLNFAPDSGGGLVVASSSSDNVTELVKRDAQQRIAWQVTLPGRLSAGPYLGPSQEIYLATCKGWECGSPHSLFAVTGEVEVEESAEGDESIE